MGGQVNRPPWLGAVVAQSSAYATAPTPKRPATAALSWGSAAAPVENDAIVTAAVGLSAGVVRVGGWSEEFALEVMTSGAVPVEECEYDVEVTVSLVTCRSVLVMVVVTGTHVFVSASAILEEATIAARTARGRMVVVCSEIYVRRGRGRREK